MNPNDYAVLFIVLAPVSAAVAAVFARWMHHRELGQRIREYGPTLHAGKSGTPTMGGAVIFTLWGLTLGGIALFHPVPERGWFIFLAGAMFGAIGFADDLLSLHFRRSLGLRAWQKLALVTVGTGVMFALFPGIARIPFRVPFSTAAVTLPAWAAFLVYWAVFLATTNSMNLTDGLDGLATGTTILILGGFLLIGGVGAIAPVLFPLIPILIGFLWVNFHPAHLFLGDVGAFTLGGAVAAVAIVTGTSFLLPILAGLLVIEAGSVIVQVAAFKGFGVRVFKISPFHHHFEHADGVNYRFLLPNVEWPEERIVMRLWIIAALFVAFGVIAAGAGGGT